MDLFETFQQSIGSLPSEYCRLNVALSGGVDSVVLLHLAHQFCQTNPAYQLSATHVHHGLSPNATDWLIFCENLCSSKGIAFSSHQVAIKKQNRKSLEALAREARYRALLENCDEQTVLLLGQHRDDQVETFLLQLKRGAGLKGLSGIPEKLRKQSGTLLLRPLLNHARAEIEKFCLENQLTHIEDESNTDLDFDRNYLRHKVIPQLNQRFIGFDKAVVRSMSIIAEQQVLIEELTEEDTKTCVTGNAVDLVALAQLSESRQKNLVRFWLAKQGAEMPSMAQLQQIFSTLVAAKPDGQPQLFIKPFTLRRYRQKMYCLPELQDLSKAQLTVKQLRNDTQVELPDNLGRLTFQKGFGVGTVRMPKADEHVSVQFHRPSIVCQPIGKPGRNKLKHWLKDANIPPWQRKRIPLLFYNQTLIAAIGVFVCEEPNFEGSKQGRLALNIDAV